MDLPSLRHFANGKIFSDPVIAYVGEAAVTAVFTDSGWYTADGLTKLEAVQKWSDGKETEQGRKESGQGDERIQGGNSPQRQARKRQRSSGKKP